MRIVVTGSTKGIGKAIVDVLAHRCSHLVLVSRTQSDLDGQQRELSEKYPDLLVSTFAVDMRDGDAVKSLGHAIIQKVSYIDVLVNNAGSYIAGSVYNESPEQLSFMIETNLYSAYYLTKVLVPTMIERRSGHIFNMCSIASKMAYPNGGSYSISKFALLGFSKNLREELKPMGIKVTALLPGATWSDSWKGADIPHERIMEANDIAIAVNSALDMSPSAVMEEIVLRPQLGDL